MSSTQPTRSLSVIELPMSYYHNPTPTPKARFKKFYKLFSTSILSRMSQTIKLRDESVISLSIRLLRARSF